MTSFIKKGTIIYFYEIEDCHGQQLMDFDITLGKDILKSDEDYKYVKGNQVLMQSEVDKAISEYMTKHYPEVHDYMYDFDEV